MTKITHFRGDTFIAPILKIGSVNFTENYLTGSVVRLMVRDLKGTLIIDNNPSYITTQVLFGKPEPTSVDMWYLTISVTIPKAAMEIPAAEYLMDWEVTYPNDVRKTYNQTTLKIKQDATYG